MKTYTLEKKPKFVNGQWVTVDFAHLGMDIHSPSRYIQGQVKGIAVENIIDYWIVDFEDKMRGVIDHPFQCVSIPHVAIVDDSDGVTRVVNIKSEAHYDVYIGRAGRGLDGYFGNPHPIGWCALCETTHERGQAIAPFKKDFLVRVEQDAEFRERVMKLKGKVLGCFCKPLPCHGDVIAEWLDTRPNS